MTQGMGFNHIVRHLRQGCNIWVAVGGARDLHPYIRKVHTGAARIAMQCGQVWLVPTHLAFEAHCQRGSCVLVELGEPIWVRKGETEDVKGRQQVRAVTVSLEERLLPLTNWLLCSKQDFGKKGCCGPGEARQAAEEWFKLRALDLVHCLHRRPTWPQRVAFVRWAAQNATDAELLEAIEALKAVETKLVEPQSCTWDLPMAFKAVPRWAAASRLEKLRNFKAPCWEPTEPRDWVERLLEKGRWDS